MIRQNLANKRIAITGSTGFVGTAQVERLLRAVPECELVLLVRPSQRHHVTERVRREIFKTDAFNRLRAELADGSETFDAMVARRVTAAREALRNRRVGAVVAAADVALVVLAEEQALRVAELHRKVGDCRHADPEGEEEYREEDVAAHALL